MTMTLHEQQVIHPARSTPQKVCISLGWGFIFIGVLGLAFPGFMGMHLSFAHNAIHLLSGIFALFFGLRERARPAYFFQHDLWRRLWPLRFVGFRLRS